jgi:MoaE-MoaD fusion protein
MGIMTVRILYFAIVRDRLGGLREEALEVEDGTTAADLPALLEARHPELSGLLSRVRIAVDEDFVDPGAPLRDGCEIALIPPVSGGA